MDRDARWRLGVRPQLDVIRAVAILLVLAEHAEVPRLTSAGSVGVTIFFTLSGFLITTLLLQEWAQHGRISVTRFYFRRACRLLPALVLFLASMAAMTALGDQETLPSQRDFMGALFYVGNYTSAMQGRDTTLLHTWSLAVEEQFYIVWPCVVLMVLARTQRRLQILAAAGLAASMLAMALRVILWDEGRGVLRVYFGTDTRMDCLLIGCVAASWLHGRQPGRSRPWLATGCLAAAASFSLTQDTLGVVVAPAVVAILTSGTILLTVQGAPVGWFASRPLVLLGRRSYGVYLWHFPLVAIAVSLPGGFKWPAVALSLVMTAAIAHLSWRCVEEPFLRIKDRAFGESSTPNSTHGPSQSVKDWRQPVQRSSVASGFRGSGSPGPRGSRAES